MHRHVLMAEGPYLFLNPGSASAVPASSPVQVDPTGSSFAEAKSVAIESFERDYLTRLMDETNGNITQAARRACKERRALGKLLKKYHIGRNRRD